MNNHFLQALCFHTPARERTAAAFRGVPDKNMIIHVTIALEMNQSALPHSYYIKKQNLLNLCKYLCAFLVFALYAAGITLKQPPLAQPIQAQGIGNVQGSAGVNSSETEGLTDETTPFVFPGPDDLFDTCKKDPAICFREAASKQIMTCSPLIGFQADIVSNKGTPIFFPQKPSPGDGQANGLKSIVQHCEGKPGHVDCVFNPVVSKVLVYHEETGVLFPYTRDIAEGESIQISTERNTSYEMHQSGYEKSLVYSSTIPEFSPASKSLGADQQCRLAVRKLVAVKKICDAIDKGDLTQGTPNLNDPSKGIMDMLQNIVQYGTTSDKSCSINDEITDLATGATKDHKQVLSDIGQYSSIYEKETEPYGIYDPPELAYCESSVFREAIKNPDWKTTRNFVQNTGLEMQNAYQKAYIMVNGIEYTDHGSSSVKSQSFDVAAVLVPKSYGMSDEYSDLKDTDPQMSYAGALRNVVAMLTPKEDFDKIVKEREEWEEKMIRLQAEKFSLLATDTFEPYVQVENCDTALAGAGNPLMRSKILQCLFAARINAGIQEKEFKVPDTTENDNCVFRQNPLTPYETNAELVTPATPPWWGPIMSVIGGAKSGTLGDAIANSVYDPGGHSDVKVTEMKTPVADSPLEVRLFMLVPNSEFGLVKSMEEYMYRVYYDPKTGDDLEKNMKEGKDTANNGMLRVDGIKIKTEEGPGNEHEKFYAEPCPPPDMTRAEVENMLPDTAARLPNANLGTGKEPCVDIFAKYEPQPDININPPMYGGWLARMLHAYTGNITSLPNDLAYAPYYTGDPDQGVLRAYWIGEGNSMENPTPSSGTPGHIPDDYKPPAVNGKATNAPFISAEQAQKYADELSDILSDPYKQCFFLSEFFAHSDHMMFEVSDQCGGMVCYEYIIQQSLATKDQLGSVLNPYVAMAMALEDGGLIGDPEYGNMGTFFGCGVNSQIKGPEDGIVNPHSATNPDVVISYQTVDKKFDCMANTLESYYSDQGMNASQTYSMYASGNPTAGRGFMNTINQRIDWYQGGSYVRDPITNKEFCEDQADEVQQKDLPVTSPAPLPTTQ